MTLHFIKYTLFFICNTFISNARLKLTKSQVKTKEHPKQHPQLLLFKNVSLSSSTLSSKSNGKYFLKMSKKKEVCLNEFMINDNEK